jgi:integrase/recombinase XerD
MSLDRKTPDSSGAPSELHRELQRYVRYLTLERGRANNTVNAYRSDLEGYLEWLEALSIRTASAITATQVSAYLEGLTGSRTTVARKLSSIKNFD